MAVYVKLLSWGIEPADAGRILKNISDTQLVTKYKDKLVDVLVDDLEATWDELNSKGRLLGLDPTEMLIMATSCNFEPEQEFGY
jgi:hypothetical protein